MRNGNIIGSYIVNEVKITYLPRTYKFERVWPSMHNNSPQRIKDAVSIIEHEKKS